MKEILSNLLALILTSLTLNGGEIPPELQSEIDGLKTAIDALSDAASEGGGEEPTDKASEVTNSLLEKLTDLATKIKNAAVKPAVMDELTKAKFVAVNAAIKAFNKNQDELGKGSKSSKVVNHDFNALVKNNGAMRVTNVNNANFAKSVEEEFSFNQILRQDGFLSGLKIMNLQPGTNQIMWTEGTRGANATAVFAIGNDRPSKTNTTATHLQATSTLGQQTTVAVQLLRALNGVQNVYQDDLKGDLEDTVALQVAAVLATANNPINTTVQMQAGAVPNISDVIEVAYLQLKPYAGGKTVKIAISTQQQKALNLLQDKNGNKLAKISYPDLEIVNFIPTVTYTDDMIFGWVAETSVRFYNDGVQIFSDEVNGIGVSGDNFKKNQISLAAQYLNEALLIRATDVVTTVYDSVSGVIGELTQGA